MSLAFDSSITDADARFPPAIVSDVTAQRGVLNCEDGVARLSRDSAGKNEPYVWSCESGCATRARDLLHTIGRRGLSRKLTSGFEDQVTSRRDVSAQSVESSDQRMRPWFLSSRMAGESIGILSDRVVAEIAIAKVTLMNLPFDPLREAILLQLTRAISTRRAQGASFEALAREFGLSRGALQVLAGCDDQAPERRVATARRRGRPNSQLLGR